MSSLFLTVANLSILKAELSRVLPDVRSSHRIEALASALGYRTYASLLASQQEADLFRPLFLPLDAAKFSVRLQSWGHQYAPEVFGHLAHLSDLIDRPWIVVPRDNRTAIDRWFLDCQQRGVPTMFIVPRRKYARLEWDCITVHPDEEQHVRNREGNDLGRAMFKAFQSMSRGLGRPFYDASSFVGHVDGLLPELAGKMADRFFHMLYDPLRKPRRATVA